MKRATAFVAVALLLALVLGALGFFIPGMLYPTLAYENSVAIDKPRAEVWKIFNDESKMKGWLEGLETIDLVEGEKGLPGSKYRLVINSGGEKIEIYETMKEIREPELYSFSLDAEPLTNEVDVRFSDGAGGTVMTQKEVVSGKSLVWRSLFFWLQSTFEANARKNLENFKRFAEAQQ